MSEGQTDFPCKYSIRTSTIVQEAVSWYRAKYLCIWEGGILLEQPGDNIVIQVLSVQEVLSNFQSIYIYIIYQIGKTSWAYSIFFYLN